MKDTEIHNGLDNELLRNFLSNSSVETYEYVKSNKKDSPSLYGFEGATSGLDWSISCSKIRSFNEKLEFDRLEKLKAILIIAGMNGWEEYDVSDYVGKTSDILYRSFFGTKEEYDNFMKVNNFEE
tara:strand:- start:14294 stop:14668 length:375 start_codon:yes stop_codon:yes gene_type:complete